MSKTDYELASSIVARQKWVMWSTMAEEERLRFEAACGHHVPRKEQSRNMQNEKASNLSDADFRRPLRNSKSSTSDF